MGLKHGISIRLGRFQRPLASSMQPVAKIPAKETLAALHRDTPTMRP
jgi:hypothetical protein